MILSEQYSQRVVERAAQDAAKLLLGKRAAQDAAKLSLGERTAQDAAKLLLGERTAEDAAKLSLRRQVQRLERELTQILLAGYPYLPVGPPSGDASEPLRDAEAGAGPRLLTLGELERQRDTLVQRLREARARTARRSESERRARARFEGMRLEPGRYRFARLPVADLGEGGCGVWQVRPRLGLIGMLAGWWELKLSSGCP